VLKRFEVGNLGLKLLRLAFIANPDCGTLTLEFRNRLLNIVTP